MRHKTQGRAWIGGLGFIGLAVLYATVARGRIDWMLVISGPLVVVGALYYCSWRRHRALYRETRRGNPGSA